MVKITIDIEKELNQRIEIYKAMTGLSSKMEAVKDILLEFFEEKENK